MPVSPGHRLAVTTDLLVEGCHFFPDVDPQLLGHKALAVNVSDLAAMGARPLGCVLGVSLPHVDDAWLADFAKGFRALAEAVGCPLIGGDTTRSLSGVVISVTAMGEVPVDGALKRSAATVGDDIWLSGTLGGPHLALELLQGRHKHLAHLLPIVRASLEKPEPPVAFGAALAGVANAAIDVSDGLLQDLGHILRASRCAAELDYSVLPVHSGLESLKSDITQPAVLAGGDVYQLCFTAPASQHARIEQLAEEHGVQVSLIGRIVPGTGVTVKGAPLAIGPDDEFGYDHFK
jgi:thiamine-monophosphate kinase